MDVRSVRAKINVLEYNVTKTLTPTPQVPDMMCLCASQDDVPSISSDDYFAFQYNAVLFFGSTDLNVSRPLILESCRQTVALEADVSVDQVKNLTLSRSTHQHRLRNLNALVAYDLQFVIEFDNYTSSQDSMSALEVSFALDPATNSKKSPFADMFFSTYVLKSGGDYYFCEPEPQQALTWAAPFHVIDGT